MTKRKRRASASGKAEYQLTEQEKAALGDHIARLNAAPIAPRIKVTNDGKVPEIGTDHPNPLVGHGLLMEALGTADYSFGSGLVSQLVNAGSKGDEIDEAGINFMLAVIKGIKPRDHLEAMLAAQMAAVHAATMTFARRLEHVENIPQQDSAARAFNQLARTFATLMETLKHYRTGGEQKVTVQHVSVSEGGQAIVGNVTQNQPDAKVGKSAASPPALTHAKTSPMPIIDESEEPAPVPARRVRKR